MTDAGFFRGTSSEQDCRFSDKQKKLLKSLKFSKILDQKVDISKINLSVIKPWIKDRITALLGFEDDVVIDFVSTQLEEENFPDPKIIQVNLTGFLEKMTSSFVADLWNLLLDAQSSPTGIPTQMLEQKKREIQTKREEQERIAQELNRIARSRFIENNNSIRNENLQTKDIIIKKESSAMQEETQKSSNSQETKRNDQERFYTTRDDRQSRNDHRENRDSHPERKRKDDRSEITDQHDRHHHHKIREDCRDHSSGHRRHDDRHEGIDKNDGSRKKSHTNDKHSDRSSHNHRSSSHRSSPTRHHDRSRTEKRRKRSTSP
eukprot:Sdes_comp18619_c0_seq1m8796